MSIFTADLFEDSEYLPGNGLRQKRKGGGSVGADYHIMKDLTWVPRATTPARKCVTRQAPTAKPMTRISSVPR